MPTRRAADAAGMASPYEIRTESVAFPIPAAPRELNGRGGSSQFHAGLLGLLALLFVGRVGAQLIQYFHEVDVLPTFDQWQSGVLPYGALVVLQLAIVAGQVRVVRAVRRGERLLPRSWRRRVTAFALMYLGVMVFRLVAGLTFANSGAWLDDRLPTIFHFILAAYLLLWMHHETGGPEAMQSGDTEAACAGGRWAARVLLYPVVSIGACLAFYVLAKSGTATAVAAYGPILVAAILIMLSELWWPYRVSWRPDRGTVTTDVVFTTVVQMVIPAFTAIAFTLVAKAFTGTGWEVRHLWPHHLPGPLQVVLMLVLADFLRYWQHRAMHRSPTLWRFHSVHHAPDRLYWLNVGRFHPLEELVQSLVDALPFVILGVDERVLAGYYVFYAVNGFFQHSNCDVRLGPLNWIVAGPELHRWHHSADISEANHNYGNKLIVWDTLFGSRYLPADRDVGELGNGEATYPTTFVGQVAAPFRRGSA
jgi:ornithine lipid hydroxylase